MSTRKAIHAYVSPDAHDAWHDFAAEQGVSVSALLEAIAIDWADRAPMNGNGDDREGLVRTARRIDADRRRRKRS